jgi:hypothetical protein
MCTLPSFIVAKTFLRDLQKNIWDGHCRNKYQGNEQKLKAKLKEGEVVSAQCGI